MCIRDRSGHGARRNVGARSRANGAALGGHWHLQRALRHRHCLLYTSDAADERSSVDLGGRRIIKKKKT